MANPNRWFFGSVLKWYVTSQVDSFSLSTTSIVLFLGGSFAELCLQAKEHRIKGLSWFFADNENGRIPDEIIRSWNFSVEKLGTKFLCLFISVGRSSSWVRFNCFFSTDQRVVWTASVPCSVQNLRCCHLRKVRKSYPHQSPGSLCLWYAPIRPSACPANPRTTSPGRRIPGLCGCSFHCMVKHQVDWGSCFSGSATFGLFCYIQRQKMQNQASSTWASSNLPAIIVVPVAVHGTVADATVTRCALVSRSTLRQVRTR